MTHQCPVAFRAPDQSSEKKHGDHVRTVNGRIHAKSTMQGKKARAGEGVGSNPGQLPEKTRDGQDWAEWAREWREDPQGKADRLVGQWEADAKEAGGSQVRS